jgi:hypothetical protein
MFLSRENPPKAPSSAGKLIHKDLKLCAADLKHLTSNKNFLLVTLACSTSYGIYTVFKLLVTAYFPPRYREDPFYDTFSEFLFLFGGILGLILTCIIIKKYSKYKIMLLIATFGTALFTYLTFSVIFIGCIALLGLFLLPVFPLCLALSVELTFTSVPEPIANGMLIFFSYLFSQPLTYLFVFLFSFLGGA